MLAVAVVTAISVFTDSLEQALVKESSRFLGADRVVNSSYPFDQTWFEVPQQYDVEQTQIVNFVSMVFSGDEMTLAAVKAVANGYPLLGELEISDTLFAVNEADIEVANTIPPPGEVWVDSRLLPLLDIELGQQIQVGRRQLRISKLVIGEPDRGGNFAGMAGPRVLMNLEDLASTDVVQPGSQVNYQWLIAGDRGDVSDFTDWLRPELEEHQRIVSLESTQENLARTLERGQSYLLLAGIIGVLLAGVAIAIAAQRFANRHVDQVALLKSLGANATRVRYLYFAQLFILAGLAAVVGVALGEIIQRLIVAALSSLFPVKLVGASFMAYFIGVLTGFVCLLFFALPPLWHLPAISPLKILRREMTVQPARAWVQGALGVGAVLLLIALYSRDLFLTAAVFSGLVAVVIVSTLLSWWLLKVGRQVGQRAGSVWRLALGSLLRNRGQSSMQMLVFAAAIMLLLTLSTIRSDLVDQWQVQIPQDAPNHIFLNIAPYEREAIAQMMADAELTSAANEVEFSPMIRARLAQINGEDITLEQREEHGVLRREINVSWRETVATDDRVVDGQWWDSRERVSQQNNQWHQQKGINVLGGVSVEVQVAERLGIDVGDHLRFSIGGLNADLVVDNLRTVNRDSFEWYLFLIEPGAFDDFSPMYRSDVFLPPEKKLFVNDVLLAHPTVMALEFDKILEQIRSIVAQVSRGVELVLWLVVAGGVVVLLAAVNASMSHRLLESGLLRALGSSRQLVLGSVWAEFSVLGLCSGLLAVLGAEVLLASLQFWLLELYPSLHLNLWPIGIIVGVVVIGALGVLGCRRVVTAAPAVVLRENS